MKYKMNININIANFVRSLKKIKYSILNFYSFLCIFHNYAVYTNSLVFFYILIFLCYL